MKTTVTNSLAVLSAAAAWLTIGSANAQAPGSHPVSPSTAATDSATQGAEGLRQEVARLREQVQALEQRLQATAPSASSQTGAIKKSMHGARGNQTMSSGQSGMGKGQMGMMDDDMPMKDSAVDSSMPAAPGSGMGKGMMDMMRSRMQGEEMMGMGAMGGMKSPAAKATPSVLPGFPGQSHLYHIGASGFFLDHPEHIALTTTQQQSLARLKEQALLRQGEQQRQIDAAEEKLWQLTGADQPQISNIDKQVKEIEGLRAEKRITFIRAVGDAARLLTDEQRQQLTGMAPAHAANGQMSMPDASQQTPSMDHM